MENMKIQVFSPDVGTDPKHISHDYWVRQHILKVIVEMGHTVVPTNSVEISDIQIILWGQRPHYEIKTEGKFRAIWLYSKPRSLPHFEVRPNCQFYTLSKLHQQMILRKGIESKILTIASNRDYVPRAKQYKYDIVYMGIHKGHRAQVLKVLAQYGYKIGVIGPHWQRFVKGQPNIKILAEFWPNEKFSEFFNLAPLSVYEIRDEYLKYGVIPLMILDIFKSSDCLCIIRQCDGLEEIFSTLPPTYSTNKELLNHVKFYLGHGSSRYKKQQQIRQCCARTWQDWLQDIIDDARKIL